MWLARKVVSTVSSSRSDRWFVVLLGCAVSTYAVGWTVFLHSFKTDARAERIFCEFGICDSYDALNSLQDQQGGNVAAVSLTDLAEFLKRDPAGPYRWEDVGEALEKSGRTEAARYCFARAITLGPRIPSMLFRDADFHFGLRENRTGLEFDAAGFAVRSGVRVSSV